MEKPVEYEAHKLSDEDRESLIKSIESVYMVQINELKEKVSKFEKIITAMVEECEKYSSDSDDGDCDCDDCKNLQSESIVEDLEVPKLERQVSMEKSFCCLAVGDNEEDKTQPEERKGD